MGNLPRDFVFGFSPVDNDHEILFGILGQLKAAARAGRPLKKICLSLCAYVDAHFENEEDLMERYEYPEIDAHRREHESMRDRAGEFALRVSAGEANAANDGIDMLKSWIEEHMLETDRVFIEFLRDRAKTVFTPVASPAA